MQYCNRAFCESQVHTEENPKGFDCLEGQLKGYNCVCGYAPKDIYCDDGGVFVSTEGKHGPGQCQDFVLLPSLAEKIKTLATPKEKEEKLREIVNSASCTCK